MFNLALMLIAWVLYLRVCIFVIYTIEYRQRQTVKCGTFDSAVINYKFLLHGRFSLNFQLAQTNSYQSDDPELLRKCL